MVSEWPIVRLGDHVDSSLGKMLDANKNKGTLAPYLGNSNVRWGQFDLADLAQMKFESHEAERYGIRDGDLIVCEGGEPGRCAIWHEQIPGMKIQKALHRVRAKPSLSNRYLFYWFMLAGRTGQLEPYFTGTTIKHLTGKALAELKVQLPPIAEQHAIAATLGALDDRIDNLRRTNATLEAIAAALFKSRFIDFDCVPPENMQESELGLIPKGWRVRTLGEAFEINPKRELKKGTIAPYLDMASLPTTGAVPNMPVPREFSSGTKFTNNDTLLARITPCLENGKTALVNFLEQGEVGWGSTEFIVLHPKPPLPPFFGYLLARRIDFREYAIRAMSGTSGRQRVEVSQLHSFKLAVPDETAAHAFAEFVEPLQTALFTNEAQAATLAALRNTLLPRLISGQLKVKQ